MLYSIMDYITLYSARALFGQGGIFFVPREAFRLDMYEVVGAEGAA